MSNSSETSRTIVIPKKAAVVPASSPPVELMTLTQVAARLQVCTKTVRKIISVKSIPIVRVGNQIRIRADHLPLFLSKQW